MTEKLHDGSRWDGDAVVDVADEVVSVRKAPDAHVLVITGEDGGLHVAYTEDVHAVLSRAGHCPNSSERADELLKRVITACRDDTPEVWPDNIMTVAEEALEYLQGKGLTIEPVASPAPRTRFVCPKCGETRWGTSNCTGPDDAMFGHCYECGFTWPRTDDAKYWHTEEKGLMP